MTTNPYISEIVVTKLTLIAASLAHVIHFPDLKNEVEIAA